VTQGPALVVRFSSLGDVLLAAHVPCFLRMAEPGRHVLFATKERYGDILRGHPDVDRFYRLEDRTSDPAAPAPLGVLGSLGDLGAALRREGVAEVFDLQQNLRSSRLVASLRDVKTTSPPKHPFRRRTMVFARWLRPKPLPPLLRTYREVAGLPPDAPLRPWLRLALTENERKRARPPEGSRPFLVLGVGARWATKRWPTASFIELARRAEAELRIDARFALGPDDSALAEELRAALPMERQAAVVTAGFRELAAIASYAAAIVSNDSAVLHLGPALGVPALGLFGSTVPGFGFAYQGPRDAVAEIDLACRPCDVHGKDRCPLGHHRCMKDLTPEIAFGALRSMLAARAGEASAGAGNASPGDAPAAGASPVETERR